MSPVGTVDPEEIRMHPALPLRVFRDSVIHQIRKTVSAEQVSIMEVPELQTSS